MSSRRDRLIKLLDSGSNPYVRKAAAEQLGEICKLHPHQLKILLSRVHNLLRSPSWDTRIAAGHAVDSIARTAPSLPSDTFGVSETADTLGCKKESTNTYQTQTSSYFHPNQINCLLGISEYDLLTFDNFDIEKIINQGTPLVASCGFEFDCSDDEGDLSKQKDGIMKHLGLSIGGQSIADGLIEGGDLIDDTLESSRLMNKSKRKARSTSKRSYSRDATGTGSGGDNTNGSEAKRLKSLPSVEEYLPPPGCWGFKPFLDFLLQDLFHPLWEVRHGASTGLRDLLKTQGDFVGGTTNGNIDNQIVLCDIALKVISVLSLDRFGDYISDEVAAPVRESAAQVLGKVAKYVTSDDVMEKILKLLLAMCSSSKWEVKHGGLLGLKYILAVRSNSISSITWLALPCVIGALQDSSDDVRSQAASSLIYVADNLVASIPNEIPNLCSILCNVLTSLDNLTTSTSSVMGLLSAIISSSEFSNVSSSLENKFFSTLTERLWNFLSHPLLCVKESCLLTILSMIESNNLNGHVLDQTLITLTNNLFQLAVVESSSTLLDIVFKTWKCAFSNSSQSGDLNVFNRVGLWVNLCLHSGILDQSKMLVDWGKCFEPVDEDNDISSNIKLYIGGCDPSMASNESLQDKVLDSRIFGCKLISVYINGLLSKLSNDTSEYIYVISYVNNLFVSQLTSKSAMQRVVSGLVIGCLNDLRLPTTIHDKVMDNVAVQLDIVLNDNVFYDELACLFLQMQSECKSVNAALGNSIGDGSHVFNLDEADKVGNSKSGNRSEDLQCKQSQLVSTVQEIRSVYQLLSMQVNVCSAWALVSFSTRPSKLNPIIRPLMDCIKCQSTAKCLQVLASEALSMLINILGSANPGPKIITNLCKIICSDSIINYLSCDNTEDQLTYVVCLFRNSSEPIETVTRSVGALRVLTALSERFGQDIASLCPCIHEFVAIGLSLSVSEWKSDEKKTQQVINSLILLISLTSYWHCSSEIMKSWFESHCLFATMCLSHAHPNVRHLASICFGCLAKKSFNRVLETFVFDVLPILDADNPTSKCGAMEAVFYMVDILSVEIVPYIPVILAATLRRMTDYIEPVRLLATRSFALLVRLLPLVTANCHDGKLKFKHDESVEFLDQLLNPKSIKNSEMKVPIKTDLRGYQQEGLNWLTFLNKYNLHGVLSDDLGLGKSLMALCVIVNHHCSLQPSLSNGETSASNISIENAGDYTKGSESCRSLVVCPPVLTGHWLHEIRKFVDCKYIKAKVYKNSTTNLPRFCDIIIVSYDTLRNDINSFVKYHWEYLVLDEGHIIRNSKTKLASAVRRIKAKHRLILTGTPIQNSVNELWALFDFLMPGFLGSEREFNNAYGKAINRYRPEVNKSTNSSNSTFADSALALDSLHRQVMPFILRRVKEDVLKDLPPKIVQDYYCDLSPLQSELYEQHYKSIKKDQSSPNNIFRSLQFLRKLCNHPLLIRDQVDSLDKVDLHDISHSPKMKALHQLLMDSGVGIRSGDSVVSQHRILIFSQSASMLDIIQHDLLESLLPAVSFLRLDGSIPPDRRHDVVLRFNDDPSIDLLLLTTSAGGLGINLTGADIVVFYDHDWNPVKDLQAMDRAHRIGQTRVVNVYRLITRATLEERIMNLQRFKLHVAKTVVSDDNASLATMNTDNILELMGLQTQSKVDKSDDPNSEEMLTRYFDSMAGDADSYKKEFNVAEFAAQ